MPDTISCAHSHGNYQIIYGKAKKKQYKDYLVTCFTQEKARTPGVIMARVASTNRNNIYVREEAIHSIFMQKWASVFDQSSFFSFQVGSDPFWIISQKIKNRTDRREATKFATLPPR